MRLLAVALLLSMLPQVSRADDGDKAPTGDLAKIQGNWTAMVGPEANIPISLEIKNQKVTIKGSFNGNDFMLGGEVVLNDKVTPKTLDWVKFTSPQGDDVPNNLAIYKIEGDRLTVCSGGPGNDRPTEFKKGENGPPNLVVFKKTRTDDKPKETCEAVDDEPKGDLAKLAGSWETKIGPNKDREIVVEFKGNTVSARFTGDNGNAMTYKGEFVLKDTASHKTIDFVKFKGDDGAELDNNLGIYKLEGDTLTLCVGGPGNARPDEFKGGDEVHMLWTFTRKK